MRRGVVAVYLPRMVVTPSGCFAYTTALGEADAVVKATANHGVVATNPVRADLPVSFFIKAKLNGLVPDAIGLGRVRYNGSTNYGACLRLKANKLELSVGRGGTWAFANGAAGSVKTGIHTYAGSAASGGYSLWADGAPLSVLNTSSNGTLPTATEDGVVDVGQGTASGATAVTGAIDGCISIGIVSQSVWSNADVAILHVNPFDVLEPLSVSRVVAGGGTDYPVTIAEAASAAETASCVIGFAPAATEAASAGDSAAAAMAAVCAIIEAASASSAEAAVTDFAAAVSEAASASDTASQAMASAPSIAESTSATDSIDGVTNRSASVDESGNATDSISGTAAGDYIATISEAAEAASLEAAVTDYLALIAEAASAEDASSASLPGSFFVAISEAASAIEVAAQVTAMTLAASESANATDDLDALLNWAVSITELVNAVTAQSVYFPSIRDFMLDISSFASFPAPITAGGASLREISSGAAPDGDIRVHPR